MADAKMREVRRNGRCIVECEVFIELKAIGRSGRYIRKTRALQPECAPLFRHGNWDPRQRPGGAGQRLDRARKPAPPIWMAGGRPRQIELLDLLKRVFELNRREARTRAGKKPDRAQ